jgi:glucose/mannose-6-phosphate isomerase
MTILDQADRWKSIDGRSMYSLIESFPEQVLAASQNGRGMAFPDARNSRAIIISGLGGSAIGGDLARAVAAPHLTVPLQVNRDYDLPRYVNASSLVIACSYSGNTEETLSSYRQARQAGAAIVCITSGGQLASWGKADGYPVLQLTGGLPPRAALGYSLMAILTALQGLKLIPDMEEPIAEAVEILDRLKQLYGTANPASGNRAKEIADSLSGKIAAIYGASGLMDAVAFRWRSQIEENAKNLALHHALPEMNHNELVGWVYPEEALRRVGVVMLRDKGDHPQVQRRFDLTGEVIAKHAGAFHEVWSEGESLLARILSVIYLGDFVSLYMAYLNHTDPTPVEVIDYLKKELSEAGTVH